MDKEKEDESGRESLAEEAAGEDLDLERIPIENLPL